MKTLLIILSIINIATIIMALRIENDKKIIRIALYMIIYNLLVIFVH